ncbi:MAG: ferritin [bacterium]|nr:ferritin [bacterium]
MINEIILEALNKQLNAEFFTTYNYLAMVAKFKSMGLHGFAHWTRVQAKQEQVHAMKFFDFINERQGTIEWKGIGAPDVGWDGPLEAFEIAHLHEMQASTQINGLVEMSIERRDHATNAFLQWFVTAQVKEETLTLEVVHNLKLVGDSGNGLFLLDSEMGKRSDRLET